MDKKAFSLINLLVVISLAATLIFVLPLRDAKADPVPAPILVVVNDGYSANRFGRYLGEILRAEGLNAFTVLDLSAVTAGELAQHALTILAETTLTAGQAAMFTSYVNGGGRLLAMRPDGQIASLFGLGASAGTLTDGYLRIRDAAVWDGQSPGAGLTTSAMQIHGAANRYALAGDGVMLAELYSGRTTPTGYPAVVGSVHGRTAAFTYDLARNVVYTRQGNPANANVDVDGDGILRTIDLFQTLGGGSPWVDRELIPVPQADEQQRLFARLVRQMVGQEKPLPQLWYFGGMEKTVLVNTADAHGNPTSYFQNEINALNNYGAKATFYLSIAGEPTNSSVQNWRSQGHEFGIHPYAYWPNSYPPYNITNLVEGYQAYSYWWSLTFTSPKSRTVRNHQVAWLGWTEAAELAVSHGIALDTNFYHWGPWLKKADNTWPHGYITGSGQAMKFVRGDGTILNNYQLLTELVDEQLLAGAGDGHEGLGTAGAVSVSRQMIDASQAGDYAALATQFHVDYFGTAQGWVQGTLDYARSLGIPRWNADTFLAFTEVRHDANYTDIRWDSAARVLTFNLEAGTGTAGLTTLLPRYYGGLELALVSVDGSPVTLISQPVKGVEMVFVRTTAGNHSFRAVYQVAGPTSTPTITPTPTRTSLVTNTPTITPTPTVPSGPFTLIHTNYEDFNTVCAIPVNVSASDRNGGSLTLSGVLRDAFEGSGLDPASWSYGSWSAGSFNPVVASGLLTLPGGGYVRSRSTYTRASIEATASFGNGAWQHIGFGDDGFSQNRYFLFSTFLGDGNLYARVNNNASEQTVNLGPIPSGMHRYRIEWQALDAANDRILFFVDGLLKSQMDVANAGASNLYFYLSNNGAANLVIDLAQAAPPYLSNGTYTSCTLDAGLNNLWETMQWDAVLAGGTALNVETRTSLDGNNWGAWSLVPFSGSPVPNPNRFIQYRISFSTTDTGVTPVLNSISLTANALATPTPTAVSNTATPTPVLTSPTPTTTSIPASLTPTSTPVSSDFPSTGILDNFNRANGTLGANWSGAVSGYAVVSNQLDVGTGGDIYWSASSFGPNQEVFVRLINIDPASAEVDLLLKSQSSLTWTSLIEVWYDAVGRRVQVWTYTNSQGWVQRGADIPVTFINGDQFGARASADGKVNVYRNGVLLGTRDVSGWPNFASGGYIGLWFINSSSSLLDDFGGGNVTVGPTPTSTRTATITTLPTSTSTRTATATALPTSTATPLPSFTSTPTATSTATTLPGTTSAPTATSTASQTPIPTNTSTATSAPTNTPTSTYTPLPSNTPTATLVPTNTLTFTQTSTPLPTNTPTATLVPSSTPTSTPTYTPLPTYSTGYLSPSANAAVTSSSGDNNGFEVTPANAYTSDGLYAVDNNSGTNTSTSCTSNGKDRHIYYNYSFNLTGATAIQGIEVLLVGKADSTTGSPRFCVQLSWNGGTNWTAAKATGVLGITDSTFVLGSPSDTWGRVWTPTQFTNANFRLRIVSVASNTSRDFSLDWIAVNVTYR